jgi:type II secretory pathway pseudopilin PulG
MRIPPFSSLRSFFKKYTLLRNLRSSSRAFTLLEIIVSTGVFVITMVILISSLVSLSNESRKARTIRMVTDNLSAAVDSIARNVRMGSTFHCGCESSPAAYDSGKDCTMDTEGAGGATCFAYESQGGSSLNPNDQVVYRLFSGRVQRSTDGGVSFLNLTAPEITISNLRFFVYGTTKTQDQPIVTVVMRGATGATTRTSTTFNLETTIAARAPNF